MLELARNAWGYVEEHESYEACGKYGVTVLLSPDCMKDVAILRVVRT